MKWPRDLKFCNYLIGSFKVVLSIKIDYTVVKVYLMSTLFTELYANQRIVKVRPQRVYTISDFLIAPFVFKPCSKNKSCVIIVVNNRKIPIENRKIIAIYFWFESQFWINVQISYKQIFSSTLTNISYRMDKLNCLGISFSKVNFLNTTIYWTFYRSAFFLLGFLTKNVWGKVFT